MLNARTLARISEYGCQAYRLTRKGRAYEMCDAVQAETYKIDGVEVSNFVLPLYFTGSEEVGGRNDFLGGSHSGKTLRSFGVNPGGYIGFFNPQTGQHETFSRKGDQEAQERMKIKLQAKAARRAIRYQRFPVHSAAAKKAGQQPRHP